MSTVLRTANRALLVCCGLGIDKTCRSCHLVVASKLNQDGNSPGWKFSNYGITWNASWGCLAWGRDRPPGAFQILRILSQSCSTKPWRSYSMQPHRPQHPHCVRKWQSLSGACFSMALVFPSCLMVFTIQSVCGHRVSRGQVQWFKLPRLDDAMMLYALHFGMNRFHLFVAKICIVYGLCLSWI